MVGMSITVDAWYDKRKGQSLLVPGQPEYNRGQCAQAANYALNEIYGLPYHYGNAVDWWKNPGDLLNNFDKIVDGSIKKGDFIVFNERVGSEYGHIDIALQDGNISNFTGADSNWGGNKTLHTVTHLNKDWVFGALRPKENNMDHKFVNEGDVKNRCRADGYEPPQDYINAWNGKIWHDFEYDWLKQPVRETSLKAKYGGTSGVPTCTPDERQYLDLLKKVSK